MIPIPRAGLRHDQCSWCGADEKHRRQGLGPTRRESCCTEGDRYRAKASEMVADKLREMVLHVLDDLRHQNELARMVNRTVAEKVAHDRAAYGSGPRRGRGAS